MGSFGPTSTLPTALWVCVIVSLQYTDHVWIVFLRYTDCVCDIVQTPHWGYAE